MSTKSTDKSQMLNSPVRGDTSSFHGSESPGNSFQVEGAAELPETIRDLLATGTRAVCVQTPRVSLILPHVPLARLAYPKNIRALGLKPKTFPGDFLDIHRELGTTAGPALLYYACRFHCGGRMKLQLLLGYDGPVKAWIDGREIFHDPNGTNPAKSDNAKILFDADKGKHEALIALDSNHGKAWGIFLCFERPDLPARGLDLSMRVIEESKRKKVDYDHPKVDCSAHMRQSLTKISTRRKSWRIPLGGYLDESNTRIRYGLLARDAQGFQPNRMVRITNIGLVPVKNPWITVNGRRKGRTLDEIIESIRRDYGPLSNNKDTMLAVWRFFCDHLYDSRGGYVMSRDPVISLNSIGFAGCFHLACMMQLVLYKMGFAKTRFTELGKWGHSVPEAYYDGRWHMIDSTLYAFFLDRAGEIAGIDDLKRDISLSKNTVTHNGAAGFDRSERSGCYEEDDDYEILPQSFRHGRTMAYELRPGESLTRHWGKTHGCYALSATPWNESNQFTLAPSEGCIVFEPDFKKVRHEIIFDSFRNIRFDDRIHLLCPESKDRKAELILKAASPYVITDAMLEFSYYRHPGNTRLSVDILAPDPWHSQFEIEAWKEIYQDEGGGGDLTARIPLGMYVASNREDQTRFEYLLRFSMRDMAGGGVNIGLRGFRLTTHIQCATYYLPALECGSNRIAYEDDTPDVPGKKVEVEFQWQECHEIKPPRPPRLLAPLDGGRLFLATPEFSWEMDHDQDIRDYHIQVSEHPDCRWPVSPSFERYISRTFFNGQKRWRPLNVMGLKKGIPYYWRLRSLSQRGVWSAWSKACRFTVI